MTYIGTKLPVYSPLADILLRDDNMLLRIWDEHECERLLLTVHIAHCQARAINRDVPVERSRHAHAVREDVLDAGCCSRSYQHNV